MQSASNGGVQADISEVGKAMLDVVVRVDALRRALKCIGAEHADIIVDDLERAYDQARVRIDQDLQAVANRAQPAGVLSHASDDGRRVHSP